MKKYSELLKQPNLGVKLLRKLRQMEELPEEGLLAGGAVGNELYNMVHAWNLEVADLDVFHVVATVSPNCMTEYMRMTQKMPHRSIGLDIRTLYDYSEKSYYPWIVNKATYTVTSTRRKGLLNDVSVVVSTYKHSPKYDNNEVILEGFDLNCCQAGLDLKTGQLIYTKAFEDFLNTRQLQVTYPATPMHSAIRLPKKVRELNCYCDYDTEMELLAQVQNHFTARQNAINTPAERKVMHIAPYFGKKYYEDYLKHKEILDNYYKYEQYGNLPMNAGLGKDNLHTLIPVKNTPSISVVRLTNCIDVRQE